MKNFLLHIFYDYMVIPWLKHIIGVSFENAGVLKEARQYIIIANHNSHFDTVTIMASLPRKNFLNTHPVAAGDYFSRSRALNFASKDILNTIHINRKRTENGLSTIDVLNGLLKNGKSLLLFPEGTRGEPGVMKDFKSGIAVLLKKNPGLPFIPVYLVGFGRVLPKDGTLIVPLNCKVRFGDPIVPDPDLSVDEILKLTQEAVLSLRKSDEREYDRFAFK